MLRAARRGGGGGVLRTHRALSGGVGGRAKRAPVGRVLVALALAGALLMCHGLLGASHVLVHGGAVSHAGGHAAWETAPHGAQSPLGPAEGPDYFAVLIALAGAALLLAASRRASRAPAGPGFPKVLRLRRFAFLPLPRGPSPPLVQVFRL